MSDPKEPAISLTQVTVWVKRSHLLKDTKHCPILSHFDPRDEQTELMFWNPLRDFTEAVVKVVYFDQLDDAGPLVVTPHHMVDYARAGKLQEVIQINQQLLELGRKVITFALTWEYLPTPKEIVFASASYRKTSDSIPCPHWLYDWHDLSEAPPKPEKAEIGFVGNIEFPNRLNRIIKNIPIPHAIKSQASESPRWRSRISISHNMAIRQVIARWARKATIKRLRQSSRIKLVHLSREQAFFLMPKNEKAKARREYLQNLTEVPYRLIIRGDANAVFSLYEAMSAGRIPVIIQTGMKLPEVPDMDWEDFAIIHPFSKLSSLPERLYQLHKELTEAEFKAMCRKSRQAFERLSPENFFQHTIYPLLKKLSPSN